MLGIKCKEKNEEEEAEEEANSGWLQQFLFDVKRESAKLLLTSFAVVLQYPSRKEDNVCTW